MRAHMYIIFNIGQLIWRQGTLQVSLDEVCQRFQAILTQGACDSTLT